MPELDDPRWLLLSSDALRHTQSAFIAALIIEGLSGLRNWAQSAQQQIIL